MYTEEEFIIAVFCLVEDEAKPLLETKLRSRGFGPQLSDAEVLTIEIVGEFLGYTTDTAIWTYFRRHWRALFPALGSRPTFARQAANLWAIKQMLHARLVRRLGAHEMEVFVVDGLPMPVCAFCRAPRVRRFGGEAAFGYCASKKQHYFGFKGEIVITASGLIVSATAIAANADERDGVWELTQGVRGLLIGDKGFIGQALAEQLARERSLKLETTAAPRAGAQDGRDGDWAAGRALPYRAGARARSLALDESDRAQDLGAHGRRLLLPPSRRRVTPVRATHRGLAIVAHRATTDYDQATRAP